VPTTIYGGAGDDTVNLNQMNALAAKLVLTLGGGADTLNVNDASSQFTEDYDLTTNGLVRTGSAAVNFDGALEKVSIDGAAGGSTFNVVPSPGTTYFFNGNSAADVLNVAMTGITSPKLKFTSMTSGEWTFANAEPVEFTGIDTVTPGAPGS
jgi:hypothetical protein